MGQAGRSQRKEGGTPTARAHRAAAGLRHLHAHKAAVVSGPQVAHRGRLCLCGVPHHGVLEAALADAHRLRRGYGTVRYGTGQGRERGHEFRRDLQGGRHMCRAPAASKAPLQACSPPTTLLHALHSPRGCRRRRASAAPGRRCRRGRLQRSRGEEADEQGEGWPRQASCCSKSLWGHGLHMPRQAARRLPAPELRSPSPPKVTAAAASWHRLLAALS